MYGSVILVCGGLGFVLYGKMVYLFFIKDGFFFNGYVCFGMIDLFVKYGYFEDVLRVFYDWFYEENVVCWNSMILGCVKSGDNGRVIEFFD